MAHTSMTAPEERRLPVTIMLVAAWFGLMTGLLKLAVLSATWLFGNSMWLGWRLLNRHYLWMIPSANLAFFGFSGLAVAMTSRFWPGQALRLAAYLYCGLASLTLLLAVPGIYVVTYVLIACGFASLFAPVFDAKWPSFLRLIRRSFPGLIAAVLALAAFSYGRLMLTEHRALASLPPTAPDATNVIVIVLDTVRADALSLYGYRRDTSPNLMRLARDGVRFQQALATAPWTLPSHASMFTWRWPHDHMANGPYLPLVTKYPTLAEALGERGYATAGFVANTTFCHADYGLARGFAHYEDSPVTPLEVLRSEKLGQGILKVLDAARFKLSEIFGERPVWRILGGDRQSPLKDHDRKDAARINRDALNWLAARKGNPFFVFLNYFDAHDPYVPPREAKRHFGSRPVTGSDFAALRDFANLENAKMPRRTLDLARDAYDDCIAFLDDRIGSLFEELETRGLLKNTLIIITADHGEGFGEHGNFGHANSLYHEEIRVPLVMIGPRRVPKGTVVSAPVSLRDIPATVLDLLGFEGEAAFPGRSLACCWESTSGSEPGAPEPVLSELSKTMSFWGNDTQKLHIWQAVASGDTT
jgi:arylsulfatase A-like enzyme